MKTIASVGLVFVGVAVFLGNLYGDGTFVPRYVEREYEGSLEQRSQEGIIVYKDGVEDLILKVTYQGKPKEFAWVIPFPSVPRIFRENAELFAELFAYVEYSIAERSRSWRFKWGKSKEEGEEWAGVRVIARKAVGSYETTTVKETVKGALNEWLKQNGYIELKAAENELEYYRNLEWVFVAIKVRDAIAEQESVDLHPLRFRFKTRQEDEMVYPLKLSVFQKSPLDVNLYIFTDSMINIGYDEKGVRTKLFAARYEEGRLLKWWQYEVEDGPEMIRTRQFFLKNYPRESFVLTNIQARGLKPDEIREWTEDLYIYPQYVYLFDPSTWYWFHWAALLAAIGAVIIAIAIILHLRRRSKTAAA